MGVDNGDVWGWDRCFWVVGMVFADFLLRVFGIKWIKVARFWALLVFFGLFGVFLRANFVDI